MGKNFGYFGEISDLAVEGGIELEFLKP